VLFSKASGLNDSIYGKSQDPIKMMLEQLEEAWQKQSIIPEVFYMDKTTNYAEKYGYETSLGNFEPTGEGGKYPETTWQEGYSKTIEPDTWKNSFVVTQEMVEDAKMGKVKSKGNAFMLSYNRTRELFGVAFLNNGNATTMSFGGKTFTISAADGQALFSTAHPSKTGGTGNQSNLYNAVMSYDTLCYAEEKGHYLTDDDGNILTVSYDTILIPDKATTKKLVFDAIGCDGQPGTADNSYNFQFGRWNVVISPYLTNWTGTSGGDMVYLLDSKYNDAYECMPWLDRIPLSVKSYVDENTDNNVFKGRARYGAAPNNWRHIMAIAPGLSGGSTF